MKEKQLDQERAITGEQRAQQALYDKQLRDIPTIVDAIKGVGSNIKLADVSAMDMVRAFGEIGHGNAKDALLAIVRAFEDGRISAQQLNEILQRASGSMRGMNADTEKMVKGIQDGALSAASLNAAMSGSGRSPFKEPIAEAGALVKAMSAIEEAGRNAGNALLELFGPALVVALNTVAEAVNSGTAAMTVWAERCQDAR